MTRPSRLLQWCVICALLLSGSLPAEDYEALLTPEDLYTYITELYTRSYDDTLLPKIEQFLQRYPDHPYADTIQQYKIVALNRQNRPADTVEAIQRYLAQYPQSAQRESFLRLQASYQYTLKDYANAAVGFRELSQSSQKLSDREDAMLALAYCLQMLQQPGEALKQYQELSASPLEDGHPARISARVNHAYYLQLEGNLQDALKLYLELLNFQHTPAELRQQLLFQAAELAYQLDQDYTRPEQFYTTLLVEFPQSELAAKALRRLCSCKFRLGKKQEFLDLCSRLRQQFPDESADPALDLATADALYTLGRYEEALPWLRKILESSAVSEEVLRQARYYEFCVLAATQQDDAVLERGDAFLEDYPNSLYKTNLLSLMAASANRRHDFSRARRYLETLLPLLAGDQTGSFEYGLVLASLYEQERLWTPAADLLEGIVAYAASEQRPALLMRAALDAEQIPDYERSMRLLDKVRTDFASQTDLLVQTAELQYQIGARAGKKDAAFQIARSLVETRDLFERIPGKEQTVWLTRLGNFFLAQEQYPKAADCFEAALKIPELPQDAKTRLLPTQTQLLLKLDDAKRLFDLLPDFLAAPNSPAFPAACYEELANYCVRHQRPASARSVWMKLLDVAEAPADLRLRGILQLSELEMDDAVQSAQGRLQELIADCERQHLAPPADAYAMLAEIHLRAKNYDLALMNVDRSLEKSRPAIFATRAATRAWWVKAQFLYERQHDLEGAKSTATLAGLLKSDERYSPMARELIIRILREQHLDQQADEEEARLRQKYPSYKPAAAQVAQ